LPKDVLDLQVTMVYGLSRNDGKSLLPLSLCS
jgi:hypothetical protein